MSKPLHPPTAKPEHPPAHKMIETPSNAGAKPEAKPAKPDPKLESASKSRSAKPEEPIRIKQPKRKRLQRRSLGEYLEKAGYDIGADELKKRIKIGLLATFAIATLVVLSIGLAQGAALGSIFVFVLGLWTAVLGAAYLLVWGTIYFFLDYRIYRRTRELEEVLPDYLQLASSNIAAGMPIDRALWYAIRPNFGILAKEMEDVAKATMAGEDLEVSLQRFTNRYDSTVLKRSINILIEGLRAGGEMADLLNKIALNIEEMKIMKKEMAASVTTYAIFITFASVVIAPILFALATELLTIIIKITGSLDTGASSSLISLGTPDPEAIANFKLFSIMMVVVTTIFSAALVSVIKKGRVLDGIKSIPVYVVVALGIYWIASGMLHAMLGGIV
jgi:Flp pilus assembly protein TadB